MRRALLIVLLVVIPAACSSDDMTRQDDGVEDVRALVRAVSTDGISATYRPGEPPVSGSGPAVGVEGNSTAITGGSSLMTLSAAETMTRMSLCVPGVEGWWDLSIPAAKHSAVVRSTLTFGQDAPAADLELRYAVAGESGEFGAATSQTVSILGVGTGALQISVSWVSPEPGDPDGSDADLDLHVFEPSGEELFYGNTLSATLGELDLDSNPNCAIDSINNENVTWTDLVGAPSGQHQVYVNLWDSCGEESVDYTVTVTLDEGEPRIYEGTLPGPGNNGVGDLTFVATVDVP
ncbi:MAG: hypothetical protein GY716_18605 [bacterium]|nr:hypothetical protein [bacterium]